ncbi:MAG: alpha/beta hydrolase [Bacteroidota bacterium]|nr:alpha/beta hydrolase [Bacteroidota bacterium]
MLPFKSSTINFTDKGRGKTVVLLHGYLESLEIWNGFADELSRTFRVIAIDLPGHGLSGVVASIHAMDLLAEAVDAVLRHLDIDKAFIIGHSMGGYVALAYLANYKRKVSGLCLFHSTPFADTAEKKSSRDREINIVKRGHAEKLFPLSIPNGFANENLEKLKDETERAIAIARQTPPEGIVAMLEGMKARPDRQILIKETSTPVLFILGEKDNHISFDLMYSVAQRSSIGEVLPLKNSGHMGFIEEPQICLETLKSFILQH